MSRIFIHPTLFDSKLVDLFVVMWTSKRMPVLPARWSVDQGAINIVCGVIVATNQKIKLKVWIDKFLTFLETFNVKVMICLKHLVSSAVVTE